MENPRDIDSSQYPKQAGIQEKAHFLIHYAVLAPSSHNTQPWQFKVYDDTIELYLDAERTLPVVDPNNRELVISCGAAIDHLRIAANFFGLGCQVQYFPDSLNNNLLAKLRLVEDHVATSNQIRLFLAIKERFTSREPFLTTPLPESLSKTFLADADNMGVELHLITQEESKSQIASLVSSGDKKQFADPAFRKELSQWMRSRQSSHHDGMSSNATGSADIFSRMNAMIIRTFDIGDGVSASDTAIAENSPMLAVIATQTDNPKDWLLAGEFLSRLLLEATITGVTAGYLNQAIEVKELREALRIQFEISGQPQILLRIGKAKFVRPSARRPITSVVNVNKAD